MRSALEIVRYGLRDVPVRLGIAGDNNAFRRTGPRDFFCAVRYDPLLRRACGMIVATEDAVCARHTIRCMVCRRAALLNVPAFPHTINGELHSTPTERAGK